MKPLEDDAEGLIALGLLGGRFAQYAASHLLSGHWAEVRYWMLVSCFARQDAKTVRIYLTDWKVQDRRPKAKVSKFVPGQHYHVLNVKFDTLDEAMEHLRRKGYEYGGLSETHVYRPE